MYRVLGISTMTESAAVYIENGIVKHAVEEERFSRIKHSGGIPYKSIDYILTTENLSIKDIDCLSLYWNPYLLPQRVLILLKNIFSNPRLLKLKIKRALNVFGGDEENESGWLDILLIKKRIKNTYNVLPKKIEFYNHHLSHVASSYYSNNSIDSNILVMDGAGEIEATSVYKVTKGEFNKLLKINLPHSLGHFYSSFTGFLGFKMLDGEYKLMGLSPYGKPEYVDWIKENILVPYKNIFYKLNISNLDYHEALTGKFSHILNNKFGGKNDDTFKKIDQKYLDLAKSVQEVFEENVFNIANFIKKKSNIENLSIVGGCGLNCKANGFILKKNIFKNIYIPPVPNDSGGALGAAYLSNKKNNMYTNSNLKSAYLGYEIKNERIEKCISKFNLQAEKLSYDELINKAVEELISNEIIAWVQGKMEFGARALGNRSFLADPRNESIIDKLNIKIKKREKFRPFAPSILNEHREDFFDLYQDADFMSFIVNVKENKRNLVPAIVHYDGSARPQTVKKSTNELYWKLINEFYNKTNIPMLLNTSYNINEPIACTEEDSFKTFINSGINKLFIGNFLVKKR